MTASDDIEAAHATLSNRTATAAELRAAADQARLVIRAIDAENELAPQREAEILARLTSKKISETISDLGRLGDEGSTRAHLRKVGTHLAAALDARAIEMAARERDPAVQREAQMQALFAKIPALFRTDHVVSTLGKSAYSRVPRPVGSHVSYIREFSVPRALGQSVMESTRVPGHWPPRHSNFAEIEQPHYMHDADEGIVAPLRQLCQKSSVSEDEVQIAIDRAQHVLLNEFARVCAEIRGHYPDGLPRFFALPAIGSPAMAAE